MIDEIDPSAPITGSAYEMSYELPRNLEQALTGASTKVIHS